MTGITGGISKFGETYEISEDINLSQSKESFNKIFTNKSN